jgi:hypothetical protein
MMFTSLKVAVVAIMLGVTGAIAAVQPIQVQQFVAQYAPAVHQVAAQPVQLQQHEMAYALPLCPIGETGPSCS